MKFLALFGVVLFYQTAALAAYGDAPARKLMELYMESKSNYAAAREEHNKALTQTNNPYFIINFYTGEIQSKKYFKNRSALEKATKRLRDTQWNLQARTYLGTANNKAARREAYTKAQEEYNTLVHQQKELLKDIQSRSVLLKKGKNNAQFQRLRSILTELDKRRKGLEADEDQADRRYGRKSRASAKISREISELNKKSNKYWAQYQKLAEDIMGEKWKKEKAKAQAHLAELVTNRHQLEGDRDVYKAALQCVNMYRDTEWTSRNTAGGADKEALKKIINNALKRSAGGGGQALPVNEAQPASSGSVQ